MPLFHRLLPSLLQGLQEDYENGGSIWKNIDRDKQPNVIHWRGKSLSLA